MTKKKFKQTDEIRELKSMQRFIARLEKFEYPNAKIAEHEALRFGFDKMENYMRGRKECLEWIIEYYHSFIKKTKT